jgi:hypothetical protein
MRLLLLKAEPTAAQIAAGNYAKRKLSYQGLRISIENERGATRSGTGPGGKKWAVTMKHPYGYILGTQGVDGDHFDCYVGPDPDAPTVYVITTMTPPDFAKPDEQKAMLGFNSAETAKAAFLAHFDNPRFFGSMKAVPIGEFKAKVASTAARPRMLKALVLVAARAIRS